MLPGKIVTEERTADVSFDNMFTEFLQENVYPEMIAHGILDSVDIVPEDVKDQFAGIDAFWYVNGEEIPVDHKTRSSVTNKECASLTFEIKMTDLTNPEGPRVHRGWLINNRLKSEYYLFAHITRAGDGRIGKDKITPENIEEVKFNLVKKSEVLSFIENNVCPVDELYGYALECEKKFNAVNNKRKKYNLPPINIRYSDGPFKKYETIFKDGSGKERTYSSICLVTSPLEEQPTNLIFQEWQINALPSSRNFFWTRKDGIIELCAK